MERCLRVLGRSWVVPVAYDLKVFRPSRGTHLHVGAYADRHVRSYADNPRMQPRVFPQVEADMRRLDHSVRSVVTIVPGISVGHTT